MQSLPDTTMPCRNTEYNGQYYHSPDLYEIIRTYAGADCWALVVNDEILYNAYDKTKTLREKIMDCVVRTTIIKKPQSVLCQLARLSTVSVIKIFMFGDKSWEVRLEYNPSNTTCDVSFYKTPQTDWDFLVPL